MMAARTTPAIIIIMAIMTTTPTIMPTVPAESIHPIWGTMKRSIARSISLVARLLKVTGH